jgi:hypothetical protein
MLIMYTHPLFKKRRRLSPPQASLGDYECACSRSDKKKTKQGAWFYRALGRRLRHKASIVPSCKRSSFIFRGARAASFFKKTRSFFGGGPGSDVGSDLGSGIWDPIGSSVHFYRGTFFFCFCEQALPRPPPI